MNDLKKLSKDVKRIAVQLNKEANERAKGAAFAATKALILATPVDTSRALSNWRVAVGFPKTKEIEPFYPGEQGTTWAASTAAAIREAKASLANKKPGQNVFITNNVKYIELLNEGRSTQAPPGWIQEVGMLSADNYLRQHPVRF